MKKNIIVLYYPVATDYFQSVPYGLLQLERMLRDTNTETYIFDEKHDENILDFIIENKERILLVGISVMLSYQIINARIFAEKIKRISNIPILFGGWFVNLAPGICLKQYFVDYIILNQGEIPFKNLVNTLLNNENNLSRIKGLGYKKDNNPVINEPQKWVNLFDFPDIDFGKIKIENYLENKNSMIQYIATHGCNCRCNFCMISDIKGSYHIVPEAEQVIRDYKKLKLIIPELSFIKSFADNLFSDKKFILDLCRLMLENNLNLGWDGSAHINQFLNLYSDSDIELMKKSGLALIHFGAESGDNDVLRNINKKYTKDKIVLVLKKLKKHKINVAFSFMLSFPPNPKKDFDITLKLIMRLLLINKKTNIATNFYMPGLNNIYHQEALKLGFGIPDTYEGFENAIKNGFNMPWITNDMKQKIFYFGYFYMPVLKLEVPLNTDKRLYNIWKVTFVLFYPIVMLRFLMRCYKFNFDARFAYWIISKFERKHGIENTNLNNFIHGISRYEKE